MTSNKFLTALRNAVGSSSPPSPARSSSASAPDSVLPPVDHPFWRSRDWHSSLSRWFNALEASLLARDAALAAAAKHERELMARLAVAESELDVLLKARDTTWAATSSSREADMISRLVALEALSPLRTMPSARAPREEDDVDAELYGNNLYENTRTTLVLKNVSAKGLSQRSPLRALNNACLY